MPKKTETLLFQGIFISHINIKIVLLYYNFLFFFLIYNLNLFASKNLLKMKETKNHFLPSKQIQYAHPDLRQTYGTSDQTAQLLICFRITSRQRRDVNRIPNRLITRRIYNISKRLFGILYASPFRISVPQINQLLLLPCPKSPNALFVDLDHSEGQISL